MDDQLKYLIELQKKDLYIDSLIEKLEILPLQIQELELTLEQEKQSFEAYRMEGKQFIIKHKEKEGELTAKEKEIGKFNQELNAIKTNEAYRAMLTQIEAAKKEKNTFEDEILELLDKIDEFNKHSKDEEAKFKHKESEVKKQVEEIQKQIHVLETDMNAKKTERGTYAQTIPELIMHQYEHIRKVKDGLAIVTIRDNGACSGCNYKLTPATINETAKRHELIFCDNCSRILYYVREASESEKK